jgi:hypothetical protein
VVDVTKGRQTRAGFKFDVLIGEDAERRWLTTTEATCEVKSDKRAQETGNIFVEYRQPDGTGGHKPSGISVTEAQYWVEEFDYDCWIAVPPQRMKRLVRYWGEHGMKRNGGDFNNYKGVLVPLRSIVYPAGDGIEVPQ